MAKGKLTIGDKVIWRGAWGQEPPIEAKVEAMELCAKGCKHGREVKTADWITVLGNGKGQVVVSLNNGHWAYGNQLTEI